MFSTDVFSEFFSPRLLESKNIEPMQAHPNVLGFLRGQVKIGAKIQQHEYFGGGLAHVKHMLYHPLSYPPALTRIFLVTLSHLKGRE